MQCKSLRESGNDLKKIDVAYFGASCDSLAKNTQFAEKLSKQTSQNFGIDILDKVRPCFHRHQIFEGRHEQRHAEP